MSNLTNQDFNQYQQGVFECSLLVFFDNSQLRRYLTMDCFITREACKVCKTQDQAMTKEPGKTTNQQWFMPTYKNQDSQDSSIQSNSTMRKTRKKTCMQSKTRIPSCRPPFALLDLEWKNKKAVDFFFENWKGIWPIILNLYTTGT